MICTYSYNRFYNSISTLHWLHGTIKLIGELHRIACDEISSPVSTDGKLIRYETCRTDVTYLAILAAVKHCLIAIRMFNEPQLENDDRIPCRPNISEVLLF